MSQSKTISKVVSRFEIGFDDETKVGIDALKSKMDEVTRALSVKNDSHGDRLLAAMQAEAANDAPITSTPWENDLKRATVNDVDYLSGNDLDESVPHIDDVLDQRNWLSESIPQITQADMQLIFIKNLSDVLIQRMHSMDRFSGDDCHIRELMPWDIVTGRNSFNDKQPNFAVVIAVSHIEHSDKSSFGIADLTSRFSLNQYVHTGQYVKITPSHNDTYRTITESELVWFRAALEACYA